MVAVEAEVDEVVDEDVARREAEMIKRVLDIPFPPPLSYSLLCVSSLTV